jgi:hypothetical protein
MARSRGLWDQQEHQGKWKIIVQAWSAGAQFTWLQLGGLRYKVVMLGDFSPFI